MPVGAKQLLLNVFDAWIIQKISSKTLDKTCLHSFFFLNDFFFFYIG